jgi:hypothetical protein
MDDKIGKKKINKDPANPESFVCSPYRLLNSIMSVND